MKKCAGLLISALVLILISYYFLGLILQSTLNKNVSAIPKSPIFSVQLDKYQRGWFSSEATLAIKMNVPEETVTDKNGVSKVQPAVHFNLDYPMTMLHGPIIFSDAGIRFGMGQVTTKPQTHYNAMVNYFNNTVIRYTFPSIAFKSQFGSQSVQFELLGIKALFQFSPNVDKTDGYFKFLGLNGTVDMATFKIGEVTMSFDLNRFQESLWLGNSHISIPTVAVNAGDKKFDLEGFEVGASSAVTSGLLNVDYDMSMQKLFVENKNYGPGDIKLSIKNLDPEAMARINKLIVKMSQNGGDQPLAKLSLLGELPKLLSKGSELELSELTLNLPEGKIVGNFKISLPKDETNDAAQIAKKAYGEGQFKAPLAVMRSLMVSFIERKLNNQTTTTVPVDTATPVTTNFNAEAQQQADKMLQDYVTKGLLKVEGTDYVLKIKIEDQKIMVNGQQFNPATLD